MANLPFHLQVPSPSSGRAEDSGRHQAEGQGQLAQRHPHEGVLLLPQSPLHFLRAAGVSELRMRRASLIKSLHRCPPQNGPC